MTPGSCATAGYPIEQLAEQSTYLEVAYLLLHGELPTTEEFDAWQHEITMHTFIHENVRKRFLEGFHYDAHPMGMLVSAVAALSTFYLDAKEIFDPVSRSKQIIRLIAKMPTLAAAAHRFSVGMPFVYPDNELDFSSNFLSMMWKVAEPHFEPDPVLARALDVLFILHADHEQNCSTTAMRVVGSSHSDPYSATAAAAAALYGPRHGGANEEVIKMLTEIGSIENVPAFIEGVKAGNGRLQGFGHRVYKNYDPRAKIIKRTADEVFEVTGKNPLLDIALKLEEIALSDEYFTSRQALPQRRLLLRPHLPGDGVPARDVPGALRHSPHRRVAGPLAGDARPGLQDRPSPPALHRCRVPRLRRHRRPQLLIRRPACHQGRSAGPHASEEAAIEGTAAGPQPGSRHSSADDPGQALLDHRDHQSSLSVEEEASGQTPGHRRPPGSRCRRAATRRPGRAGGTTCSGRGWPP